MDRRNHNIDEHDHCDCPHWNEGPEDHHRRVDLIACEVVGHVRREHSGAPPRVVHPMSVGFVYGRLLGPYKYHDCSRCGVFLDGELPQFEESRNTNELRDMIHSMAWAVGAHARRPDRALLTNIKDSDLT